MTDIALSLPLLQPPNLLIVVGMHRSGTSALMGALHQLGLHLGNHLLPEQDDNKAGFWENAQIVAFNQRFLEHFNRDWHSVLPLPAFDPKDSDLPGKVAELAVLLETERGNASCLGIKDPRMCRLLPFWLDVLQEKRLSSAFCLILRNPFEVAASLWKRDGFSRGKSMLLWLDHVLEAEIHTRGYPRLWFDYAELMQQKSRAIRRIAEAGFLPWTEIAAEKEATLESFLNEDLRNHQSSSYQAKSPLEKLCLQLYETLRSQPESQEAYRMVEDARNLWKKSQGLFEEFLTDQNMQLTLLQNEVSSARRAHQARDLLEASLRSELAQVQDVKDEKDKLQSQVGALETELRTAHQIHAELMSQITTAQQIHLELSAQIERAKEGHAIKDAQLEDARSNIQTLAAQVNASRENIGLLEGQISQARDSFGKLQTQLEEAAKNHAIQVGMLEDLQRERAEFLRATSEASAALQSKDRQIEDARKNITVLQEQIETARQAHLEKDHQIESARVAIQSLSQQIDTARSVHDQKEAEIEAARSLNHSLQTNLSELQAAHQAMLKEFTKLQSGQHLATLENSVAEFKDEIDLARKVHDAKDAEIAVARSLNESLKRDLANLQDQYHQVCQKLEAANSAQATIDALRAEIDYARQVHDQKVQEIAHARKIHDAKLAEIDAARRNMAILAEQIEDAKKAHLARDQIEADLRQEIRRLRESLHPRPRTTIEPSLTPQPER